MDILKEIIKKLSPSLKKLGFSKKGNTFYLKLGKNYGILNFQKSQDSKDDFLKFTINFGIYSDIIGKTLDFDYDELIIPDVWSCHWQARVGEFMLNKPDYWCKIGISDNLDNTCLDLVDTIQNIILPEMNKRLSDDDLINSWINNEFAGTTEVGRFKYLTTLIKAKGDFDLLDNVIRKFMHDSKDKPNAKIAINHLNEIEYNFN